MAAGHHDLDGVRRRDRHQPGGGDRRRRDLLEAVDAGAVERGHDHAVGVASGRHHGGHVVGQRTVGLEARLVRVVLDLDVDGHAHAGVQRGVEVGHGGRQLVGWRRGDRPAVGQVRVVVDDEPAVGRPADVELDHVGPHLGRPAEGRHGVLGRRSGRAAVGDDTCHTVRTSGNEHLSRGPCQVVPGRLRCAGPCLVQVVPLSHWHVNALTRPPGLPGPRRR